jgi:hypothetical protein
MTRTFMEPQPGGRMKASRVPQAEKSERFHSCQQIRLTLTRLHPYQQSRLQIFMGYAIASHKEVVQP